MELDFAIAIINAERKLFFFWLLCRNNVNAKLPKCGARSRHGRMIRISTILMLNTRANVKINERPTEVGQIIGASSWIWTSPTIAEVKVKEFRLKETFWPFTE